MSVLDSFALPGPGCSSPARTAAFGRAFALAWAEAGADVAIAARDAERTRSSYGDRGSRSAEARSTGRYHCPGGRHRDGRRVTAAYAASMSWSTTPNRDHRLHSKSRRGMAQVLDLNGTRLMECSTAVARGMIDAGGG